MIILLIFSFLSGLVTIFAPCIWPLLPIILSSSLGGGRRKSFGITLGIMMSFSFFTLTLSYLVKIIPFDPNILRLIAVCIIGFLGLTLVIPQLSTILEGWVSRLSGKFSPATKRNGDSFGAGFITGFALGIVWTPCAGPILATIATLAATQQLNSATVLVTLVYVTGVGIPLFVFSLFGNKVLAQNKTLSKYTGRIQQIFGVMMILTAIAIFTNFDKTVQLRLLDAVPSYSTFINKLENNSQVQTQLNQLRGSNPQPKITMPFPQTDRLPVLGHAPEFEGITQWLHSQPLTLSQLKGKVVLIDFWTYTCINCIRTLPYITKWYEKYKDQGFVVIGVHTPEFEFEKKTENVVEATKKYSITYPVAQDNEYATWQAYDNHYWPAHYLLDADGNIRYTHFGEGEYEQTEMNIKTLLKEAGKKTDDAVINIEDQTPQSAQTPETYLGSLRIERFASEEQIDQGIHTYTIPTTMPTHHFAYGGKWDVQEEYAKPQQGAKLELHYLANKVFLVITPQSPQDKIKILLDGKVVSAKDAGADVKNGYVVLDSPRLYNLINSQERTEHTLLLEFETGEVQVFAFTFG